MHCKIMRGCAKVARHREAAIHTKTIARIRFGSLVCLLVMPGPAEAAELKPEAVQGFDRYVHLTERRMRTELQPGAAFLWADGLPETRRNSTYAQLQRGEVVTERLETRDISGDLRTPGALLHHWVGTAFIRGASLQRVLTILEDYDHHSVYFSPEVAKSKTLEHTGNDFKVYLRLRRKKIVTVVLDTEYEVHYEQIGAARFQSRSYSTHITEVTHPGESSELQVPAGKDNGYLWRLYSYWRFVDTGRGVYVQCEAISLTRDIPTGLHWLIAPFIESIPKESLEFTLRSARNAIVSENLHASQ